MCEKLLVSLSREFFDMDHLRMSVTNISGVYETTYDASVMFIAAEQVVLCEDVQVFRSAGRMICGILFELDCWSPSKASCGTPRCAGIGS